MGIATTEVTVDSVEDVRIVVDRPGLVSGRIVYEGNVPASSRATSLVARAEAAQGVCAVSGAGVVNRLEWTIRTPQHRRRIRIRARGPGSGLSIKRVMRNGRALPMNRIGVALGETVRDIEIVVGR